MDKLAGAGAGAGAEVAPTIGDARPVMEPGQIVVGGVSMASGAAGAGDAAVADPPKVNFYKVLGEGKDAAGLTEQAMRTNRRDLPDPPRPTPPAPASKPASAPEPAALASASKPDPHPATAAAAPSGETAMSASKPGTRVAAQDAAQGAAKPAAKTASGAYAIQVASFSRKDSAQELLLRLKKEGFDDTYVKQVELDGRGTWYRVRVGHFADETAARWESLALSKAGLDPIVVHDDEAAR